MTALATGTQIAGYRIEQWLGFGGMADVYEATELLLERPVALKVLHADLAERDLTVIDRFRREAQIQARITHRHIVEVYDSGESNGRMYIAMRLVRGPTLRELIREKQLTPERTLGLLRQIAEALDAAHERDLVHRDVKPHNILVEGETAYLADFGIAKSRMDSRALTRTNMFVGTPDYSAPEQLELNLATAASDIYALGAVLFECLTGRKPFPESESIDYERPDRDPPRVTDVRPELARELDALMARAMAKSPSARPRTALALVEAAEVALAGGSPSLVLGPLRGAPRKRRRLVVPALAGCAAIAAAAV